jgi:hypothetical protein
MWERLEPLNGNDVKAKDLQPSWARMATSREMDSVLYPSQISASLEVQDIPMELVWTRGMWEKLLRSLRKGQSIEPLDYPGGQHDLTLAFERWAPASAKVLVIGSVSPWVEALLYEHGCRNIVTLDLRKPRSEIEDLRTVDYREWDRAGRRVDALVSFSTVEHIGLGRYGDAEDEDGDVSWMNDFAYRTLNEGGVQLLAVPVGEADVSSEAHRIYSPERMARLLKRWTLLGVIFEGRFMMEIPFSKPHRGQDWQKQPVLAIRPQASE